MSDRTCQYLRTFSLPHIAFNDKKKFNERGAEHYRDDDDSSSNLSIWHYKFLQIVTSIRDCLAHWHFNVLILVLTSSSQEDLSCFSLVDNILDGRLFRPV